jgi:integrase
LRSRSIRNVSEIGMSRDRLTVNDIDYDTGTYGMIRVRAKSIGGESWKPKTGVNRAVPISCDLRAYLDKYKPGISDHGWFFPGPQGRRWDCDNFSRDLRDINRHAGLDWGCLDFRHTFGSQLAMANISLHKISKLMGNSPEICRRHYAALVPEDMADVVEFPQPQSAEPLLRLSRTQSASSQTTTPRRDALPHSCPHAL